MMRLLAAVLFPALLALGTPMAATGQAGPSVFVAPATQTVPVDGGAFETRIMVDGVTTSQGLGGYALAMTYDPSVVHALSINDSGLVGSTGNDVLCAVSTIDNDAGELAQVCITIPIFGGPGPQVMEPEVLVTVTFEPVGVGATALAIGETSIVDVQGDELGAATSDGSVTVEAAGAPTPGGPDADQPGEGPLDAQGGESAGPGETPSTTAAGVSPTAEPTSGRPALPVLGTGSDSASTNRGQFVTLGLLAFGAAAVFGASLLARKTREKGRSRG